MLDNKGFTLVELLAVIAILGLVMVVGIQGVSSSLLNIDDKDLKSKKELIYSSLELYLSMNKEYRDEFLEGNCGVSLDMLVDSGWIDKSDMLDSKGNKIGTYVIYQDDSYEIVDTEIEECQG